jgi:signal transduction histidine kinase
VSANRLIVDRMHEVFNARRFEDLGEVLDEDVLMVIEGTALRGVSAVRDYLAGFVRRVPGLRVEVERVLADSGDTIVTLTRSVDTSPARAGHTQDAGPLPITTHCVVRRIVGGRIVEWRIYLDAAPGDEQPIPSPLNWAGIHRLVSEQEAWRRVATLVARGAAQSEVFDAIVSEAAELFGQETWLYRFRPDGTVAMVAQRGAAPVGDLTGYGQRGLGDGVSGRVRRTGRPARVDSYAGLTGPGPERARKLGIVASAAAPLVVQGRQWGGLMVTSRAAPLAEGIEDRLALFADLAATAVANAQSRAELQSVADEQSALRRVAELVARGAAMQEVFDQVTIEASRLLDDKPMTLMRYEPSAEAVVVAAQGIPEPAVGGRVPVQGENGCARVWRTGRAVRVDNDYQAVASADEPRWIKAVVLTPIVVEGRLWGLLGAPSASPLPAGTEERLGRFGGLVAAAIANAESRAALTASRARIIASADEARRRLARDVHDGAQQRLVHALLRLGQARAAIDGTDGTTATKLLEESFVQVQTANAQLRELAHGILPAALARGGLRDGVQSLLRHAPLRVDVDVLAGRLPEPVETTAYFVIAEALTNVIKHAGADRTRVRAFAQGDRLEVEVSDDGRGGADPADGSGLTGLIDRVEAIGGSMTVSSPPGGGTVLSITLPIEPSATPERE